jgi:16S rRNA (cytosine967-C5)-methyltransferase
VPGSARPLALSVLGALRRGGQTLADALAQQEIQSLDTRERAFLHELVLGTLRQRGWLDHVIDPLARRPGSRPRPAVRDVLRLGAYQLLFLRVPPHAAISESVSLARTVAPRGGAAGFVNAVLRRLQREGPSPPPDPEADTLAWLTSAGSLPPWLARRWMARHGPREAVARARALLQPSPTYLRFNPRVPGAHDAALGAGLQVEATDLHEVWRATAGPVGALAERGLVYVQDLGSQLVARLAVAPGRILDACAAPGGKALLVADEIGTAGRVVAAEAVPRRLRTLAALRVRWSADDVLLVGADGRRPPFRAPFEVILVDAPCSGLGTLARHPDIRWRLRPTDLPRQARRQGALLEALAPLVRPGGLLVYATCSVEDEENEGVIEPFLESHREFGLESLPPWAGPYASASGEFVKMSPARHSADSFFAACLRRVREAAERCGNLGGHAGDETGLI